MAMQRIEDIGEAFFLVFSDDWGEHPSSCQHIFRHIARHHKVVWVNTIGMRKPQLTLSDLKKIVCKVRKMLFGGREWKKPPAERLQITVCQPAMLPFSGSRLVRKYNKWVVSQGVRRALKRVGIERPILIATVPNACDYVGACGEARVVYYCVDDFTEWPGLEHDMVREMERKLIEKADIFIATSQKLYDKLFRQNKPTFLLSHGVDLDFFSNKQPDEHPLLNGIPRPRLGYFGLFDERSDQKTLREIASALPEVSFVITGRVETDVADLQKLANIFFTGPVPYAELPMMVHGWDVCFLLYVCSSLTDSISPLKLKEYLATGKPVISSPLPEAKNMASFLYLAESAPDWIGLVRKLLFAENSTPAEPPSAELLGFLQEASWQRKALTFLEIAAEGLHGDNNRKAV